MNTIDKVFFDPAIQERDMVISVDHFGQELRLFGNPIKMSEIEEEVFKRPPRLGEHTDRILSEVLNYSPEEIRRLRERKII